MCVCVHGTDVCLCFRLTANYASDGKRHLFSLLVVAAHHALCHLRQGLRPRRFGQTSFAHTHAHKLKWAKNISHTSTTTILIEATRNRIPFKSCSPAVELLFSTHVHYTGRYRVAIINDLSVNQLILSLFTDTRHIWQPWAGIYVHMEMCVCVLYIIMYIF